MIFFKVFNIAIIDRIHISTALIMNKKKDLSRDNLKLQSIKDFGNQWELYSENKGYHASLILFKDIIEPLLSLEDFDQKLVAEVGSGNGRIIEMLTKTEAAHIYSIEPSDGYKLIKKKFSNRKKRITAIKSTGELFTTSKKLDLILSIGVLHHIPKPDIVLLNCLNNLKSGGRIFVWLYGQEGNHIYLFIIRILRIFTIRMPDKLLKRLVDLIYFPLSLYIKLSSFFRLPMSGYMNKVIGKMDSESKKQIIFDQLNPIYSKYYKYNEVLDLLTRNGFKDIKIHCRHGYSYSASAIKP